MADKQPQTIGDCPDLRNFVIKVGLQAIADAKKTGCQHMAPIINVVAWPGSEIANNGVPFDMGICSECTTSRCVLPFEFPQLIPGRID